MFVYIVSQLLKILMNCTYSLCLIFLIVNKLPFQGFVHHKEKEETERFLIGITCCFYVSHQFTTLFSGTLECIMLKINAIKDTHTHVMKNWWYSYEFVPNFWCQNSTRTFCFLLSDLLSERYLFVSSSIRWHILIISHKLYFCSNRSNKGVFVNFNIYGMDQV